MNIQRLRLRERERVGRSRLLLEGKGGRDSGAGSAFKTASIIKQCYGEIPENHSRNLALGPSFDPSGGFLHLDEFAESLFRKAAER